MSRHRIDARQRRVRLCQAPIQRDRAIACRPRLIQQTCRPRHPILQEIRPPQPRLRQRETRILHQHLLQQIDRIRHILPDVIPLQQRIGLQKLIVQICRHRLCRHGAMLARKPRAAAHAKNKSGHNQNTGNRRCDPSRPPPRPRAPALSLAPRSRRRPQRLRQCARQRPRTREPPLRVRVHRPLHRPHKRIRQIRPMIEHRSPHRLHIRHRGCYMSRGRRIFAALFRCPRVVSTIARILSRHQKEQQHTHRIQVARRGCAFPAQQLRSHVARRSREISLVAAQRA